MPQNFIEHFFSNYLVITVLVAALVAYHIVTRKFKNLPSVPVRLLIIYIILDIVSKLLPADLDSRVIRGVSVAMDIVLYSALVRIAFSLFVDSWFKWHLKIKVPKITRDLVLIISYTVVVFVVLRTKGGVNLIGLITTSAVLTAVIGFAAQNVLGNLLAGLSIQFEHPFRIGDWLQYGDHVGKVIGIGWESTKLKTFDDEMIIIPNLDISKAVLKNHSLPTPRHAMKIDVGIDYGAAPNSVRKVLLDLCAQESRILKDPAPAVRITSYGDFAIVYQIRFFYNDYGTSIDLRSSVMNKIWYALKRNGIKIPYPVRDVRLSHIERRFVEEEQSRLRALAVADLKNVPILKPLSSESRLLLSERLAIEEYGDGEIIVSQGDAGDSLYIIHRGACDIEVSAMGGPSKKVASLAPPAFFGEMSLLTGEPRSATVRSIGDSVVFSIDKDIFREVLVSHPGISEELARALAERQGETAEVVGHQTEEREKQTSKLLGRIKSFFGIS